MRVVGRVNAHHDARVGIALVARILAHAVGHHPFGLRGRGHHCAAGAHAKAVNAAAIFGVVHQLVVGRTQKRVTGVAAPAGAVDHALRVLNAKTHRERLGLHGHALRPEHGKGVACAVAQGHHYVVGGQLLQRAAGQVQHLQAADAAHVALSGRVRGRVGGGADVRHALAKAHFAAQGDDACAQVFHHLDQLEGADVRVRFDQDLGRCTGFHKLLHHLAPQVARVFDLAPELAVRERAGAAFAKLHIALGVQRVFAPQVPGVFGALAYRRAAFEHDGFESHLRQQQRGKHAAGPKAHHHRAQGQRGRGLAHRVVGHVGRGAYVRVLGKLGQQALLGCRVQRHIHNKHRQQICLARIKTAFEDLQALDVVHRHAQRLCGHAGKRGQRVRRGAAVFVGFTGGVGGAPGIDRQGGQGEFEFGDSQHVRGSELSSKAPIIRKGAAGRP